MVDGLAAVDSAVDVAAPGAAGAAVAVGFVPKLRAEEVGAVEVAGAPKDRAGGDRIVSIRRDAAAVVRTWGT